MSGTGNAKGYRILNPRTSRIWINRSIRIIEQNANQLSLHRILLKKGIHNNEAESIEYELSEESTKSL